MCSSIRIIIMTTLLVLLLLISIDIRSVVLEAIVVVVVVVVVAAAAAAVTSTVAVSFCLQMSGEDFVWQHLQTEFCKSDIFADGHTVSNAPDLFRPPKLSGTGPGQYWGGGPPGKTLGCCQLLPFCSNAMCTD